MIADAGRVVLLLLFGTLGVLAAFQIPGDVFLDFGPNDGRYVRGFREDFEVDEPTIIHWSGHRSTVTLPFRIQGPYELTLRYKRHIAAPAEVRFFLGDELVDTVVVPRQDFGLLTLRTANEIGGPFELRILSRSADPRPLGIALDWMQLRPSRQFGAVLPDAAAWITMLSWIVAFYLAARLVGSSATVASLSGGAAAIALAVTAAAHKLWPVHASLTIAWRAHAVTLLLVAFYLLRRRVPGSAFALPEARWATYVVLVGLAVRLFALFHPDFYYPDVRTHSKFVSLIWTEGLGDFFTDYIDNQHTHLLGLQLVGDRWLAFPYPPLLYLAIYPLSLLQLPVEDWMKLVPTALVAVEAMILFALAVRLGISSKAALVAVLLHATARVLAFRLAVASYAAMFGHFWDMVVVLYLVFFFERIERPLYAAGFAGLVAISILSYAGSTLVLGLFVPAFCIAFALVKRLRGTSPRPDARRLIAIAGWSLAGALVAIGSFYWQYVPEVLLQPGAAATSSDLLELRLTPWSALTMAARRLNIFYGIFGFVALASLVFVARRIESVLALALGASAIATYLGMNFLRAGLGATHIFQFSKDDLVILPVVVIALGIVAISWREARMGRLALAAVLAGWVGWGAVSLANDVRGRFIRPEYPPTDAPTISRLQ